MVDAQNHTGVSLANIKILKSGKGLTCDNDGYFTMYVSKGDTLEFSSVGYITHDYGVAKFDSSRYYTLEIELLHDFIKLKEVTIYPFHDIDELRRPL